MPNFKYFSVFKTWQIFVSNGSVLKDSYLFFEMEGRWAAEVTNYYSHIFFCEIGKKNVKAFFASKVIGNYLAYTLLRICSTPTFPYFNLSEFEREPLKLRKQMISHFVALDVSSKICQVQLCSSIRSCHRTFLLESILFKGEVAWQPLVEQQDCSPSTLESRIRAFK